MASSRPIRFNRFGGYYVLFSIAVGAAAINTGNNLLYLMLGLLLGFIIISGILSDSSLWGARLHLEPKGDLYAGQEAEFEVAVQKSFFPAVLVRLELLWENIPASVLSIPYVPRRTEVRERLALVPVRRGYLRVNTARLSTSFPFGLLEKSYRQHLEGSWVVFPKVRPLPLSLLRSAGSRPVDQSSARRGVGVIPFDLRPYQEGDTIKHVHWKSTAKRGEWMVAEMEDESGAGHLVTVSAWPTGEALEDFISFVASLLTTLYRQGSPIGLQTPGVFIKAGQSPDLMKKMLRYLALVNPAHEKPMGTVSDTRHGLDALRLWKNRP